MSNICKEFILNVDKKIASFNKCEEQNKYSKNNGTLCFIKNYLN